MGTFVCKKIYEFDYIQLIQKHRQSKYRLLQCYASGNVNVVDELSKKVPATKNKRYKNSWNSNDQLVPERFSSFIYDIIAKGRYTGPGEIATLLRVQDCLAFLEQQKRQSNASSKKLQVTRKAELSKP